MQSDWVASGEVTTCCGFVDDHYWIAAGDIMVIEEAAAKQRNVHGLEIVGSDDLRRDKWIFAKSLAYGAFWTEVDEESAGRDRKMLHRSDRLNAGNRLHFFDQASKEFRPLRRLRIARLRKLQRERSDVVRIEAGIHAG